jgi:hypothetical protein
LGCCWVICTHIHGIVKKKIDWKLEAHGNVAVGCTN